MSCTGSEDKSIEAMREESAVSESLPPRLEIAVPECDDSAAVGGVPAEVDMADKGKIIQKPPLTLSIYTEMPQEAVLRSGVISILEGTVDDEEEMMSVREICIETLAKMTSMTTTPMTTAVRYDGAGAKEGVEEDADVVNGKASVTKSPQRMVAFSPDKMKPKLSRRPSCESMMANDTPRWKVLDGNEEPIMDITVIFRGDPVPAGYSKLERSPSGQRADLNKGGRGTFIYLCLSKDPSDDKTPISEIIAIFPERREFVPRGYEVVRRRGVPANINTGTQGEKIFLCYKRSATSAVVDLAVLFPKKGDTLPYGYMKVDKSPYGHIADLNSSSGGTEVFISYKKKLTCISDLHKRWLFATVTPPQDTGHATHPCSPLPLTPRKPCASPTKSMLKSLTSSKSTEIREQEVLLSPGSSGTHTPTPSSRGERIGWKETIEYYMYPMLLACCTRHGNAAQAAVRGLTQCLDEGVFDTPGSRLCCLEVVIDAVTSACLQAVDARFDLVLHFFHKVVRKCSNGFKPSILHSILKALTFIGDFDSSLGKLLEDELVSKVMKSYEVALNEKEVMTAEKRESICAQSPEMLARELVVNLIEDISTGAEIATITDNLLGVVKSHSSIQSLTFCSDITAAMESYANPIAEKNALQLLVTLSKAANRKHVGLGEAAGESEQYSSVHSLRFLNQTLVAAGARTREQRVFGQVVRRFVLSAVNSSVLTWLPGVFRVSLVLVSTLWNHYRRYLKVELALMFEHILLRILRSTAPCAKNHQMDIMHEIILWLQLPHNVVEIFLNFDLDRVQQWKIFEHLCSTMCSMGEGNMNTAHIPSVEDGDDSGLQLQIQAIDTVLAIARSVMDASGHAHLISRDQRTRMLSMENGGWEQDESGEEASPIKESIVSPCSALSDASSDRLSQPNSPTSAKAPPDSSKRPPSLKYGNNSVRMRNEVQKHNQQLLKRAMEISSSKSLKKAIEYLVAMNFIKDTPRSITSFLRIYHDFFDEAEIGDYLGESDEDFKVQVRLTYVRAISFKGMTLVESLRHFLTNGGFRLPGEAQKIERMVEAFAQCYVSDSPAAFSSADTAMIIAYSIIMLNTDLHNPQVKKNKMTKEQFLKNNRGIDNGKDLPKRFLEEIYDDIAQNPMHIKGSRVIPKASREASVTAADLENEKFCSGIAKAVSQSEELMKDLSHAYNTFQFVGVDTAISPDLIKILFERVWFYLLALSTSILSDSQSNLSTQVQCLDLLRLCISTCLFLDMPIERQAYCGLLRKVQDSLDGTTCEDRNEQKDDLIEPMAAKKYEWVRNIQDAAARDEPWQVMGDIHVLVNDMKETIQVRQKSEKLGSVIQRIYRGNFYLKTSTTFIHEGDLTKKCRSRNQVYRFFLFNDQLLYADRSMTGSWSPHNALRLKLTRISNISDGVLSKNAFQIQNPVKSFVVFADTSSSKAEWMRLMDEAISEASKKINRTARRISTHNITETRILSPVPASMASTALKVFMRFGSPLSSPTAAYRESFVTRESNKASSIKYEVTGNNAGTVEPENANSREQAIPMVDRTLTDEKDEDSANIESISTVDVCDLTLEVVALDEARRNAEDSADIVAEVSVSTNDELTNKPATIVS